MGIGGPHHLATEEEAEAYLAALGANTQLMASTISAHRTALSTTHEKLHAPAPNPWVTARTKRLLKGIEYVLAPAEAAAKMLEPERLVLTPAVLAAIAPAFRAMGAHELRTWAAVCMGTCAMLRPSEFITHENREGRQLGTLDVTFRTHATGRATAALSPRGESWQHRPLPDHYVAFLGPTKADQRALNAASPVSNPLAVRAMWDWMHTRREQSLAKDDLFYSNSGRLSLAHVLDRVRVALIAVGYANPHVHGKMFRQGGASHLAALGTPLSQSALMGRWRCAQVANVYSSAQSKAEGVLAISRLMQVSGQHPSHRPAAAGPG